MADIKGDKSKQPEGCEETESTCPNMKMRDDFDTEGETYECAVCGARYKLYYEDMA